METLALLDIAYADNKFEKVKKLHKGALLGRQLLYSILGLRGF